MMSLSDQGEEIHPIDDDEDIRLTYHPYEVPEMDTAPYMRRAVYFTTHSLSY